MWPGTLCGAAPSPCAHRCSSLWAGFFMECGWVVGCSDVVWVMHSACAPRCAIAVWRLWLRGLDDG